MTTSDDSGRPSTVVFSRTVEWDGVRVKHSRVRRGGSQKYCHAQHLIAVPLFGSVRAEPQSLTSGRGVVLRGVGHTSIVPFGEPYLTHFDEEVEYLVIYLEPALLARAASDSADAGSVHLAHASDARDPLVRQVALALMAEAESGGAVDRLYVDSLTAALAAHLLRHYAITGGRVRPSSGGLPGRKLLRAVGFMEEHLEGAVTLAEVAECAGLSPFHFARAFKRTTGLTPHQYLVKLRVERAKRLLARRDLTIAEVGHRAGFKNQSHFTTLFRRLTSVTPGDYRKAALR
jgi:AraC family transcriptional regulator